MKKTMFLFLISVFTLGFVLYGCGNDNESNDNSGVKDTIKIGTTGESTVLAESGKKALESKGYNVEIVVFDDYVLPNTALADGSIDANLYQHEPYMKNFNEANGKDLTMLSPKLYNYYTGIYSVKAKTIENLPEGGVVGIINEASNIHEQLQQLQEVGIIKLKDSPSSGKFYSIADIDENLKNYEFVPSDHLKYKNMDEYVFLMGTSSTMAKSGVNPTENLLHKFVDNELAEGLCILKENENKDWVKDMIEAYTSEEARNKVPSSTGFEPAI